MCLTTRFIATENPKEVLRKRLSIAKKDMHVWKVMVEGEQFDLETRKTQRVFVAKMQRMKYVPYRLYKTHIKPERLGMKGMVKLTIGPGFHSFTSEEAARRNCYHGQCMVLCIIPKGAKYIRGYDKQIVSNMIVVTNVSLSREEIFNAKRYSQ